jgi:GTP-binding protein Era
MEPSRTDTTPPPHLRSGFVAIVGPPNSGKSTLLNRILGQKISITARKPQTTRNRILGVLHRPDAQIVFLDTPGIHRAHHPLNRRIVEAAFSSIGDADLILMVADAIDPDPVSEALLLERFTIEKAKPVLLALNKIDLLSRDSVSPLVEAWQSRFAFVEIVPVSARHGSGIELLLSKIESRLPLGPPFYPEDAVTDSSERFLAGEMIREKVFRFTGEEIPYSTAVTVEAYSVHPTSGKIRIEATIHVERDSQKGILIGKGGGKLKQIGEEARREIEKMAGTGVFLKLFIRVQKNWSRDTKSLRRFGYE